MDVSWNDRSGPNLNKFSIEKWTDEQFEKEDLEIESIFKSKITQFNNNVLRNRMNLWICD